MGKKNEDAESTRLAQSNNNIGKVELILRRGFPDSSNLANFLPKLRSFKAKALTGLRASRNSSFLSFSRGNSRKRRGKRAAKKLKEKKKGLRMKKKLEERNDRYKKNATESSAYIYIYISILRRVQSSFSGALDCSTFPLEFLLFAVFILPIESGRME